MFLVDTNVLSEIRRQQRAEPAVMRWAGTTDTNTLFISVVTIMELEIGGLRLQRKDPVQAARLGDWLENVIVPGFSRRILPIDEAVARRCASLHVPDRRTERDALIAATALVHGLTVVTRNIRDFEATGVPLLNPWEPA